MLLLILLLIHFSSFSMDPDTHIVQVNDHDYETPRQSQMMSPRRSSSSNHDEAIARRILCSVFGECNYEGNRDQILPHLKKKIIELRDTRNSQYRALRRSLLNNLHLAESTEGHIDPALRDLLSQAIKESYKEKELETKQRLEEIKSSRIKFTVFISSLTGLIAAGISAAVTVYISSQEQPVCPVSE